MELEWIGLGHALEGEAETRRGEFSTSVDAFLVAETGKARRAYLLEWKYTESYGENDKGRGRKGQTRRRRYGEPYAASPAFRDRVPLDAWLHDPFYQLMRQRLLADRMVARREFGVSEAKIVLVLPDGNDGYRLSMTSPALRAAFPDAATVEAVTRAGHERTGPGFRRREPARNGGMRTGKVRRCGAVLVRLPPRPIRVVGDQSAVGGRRHRLGGDVVRGRVHDNQPSRPPSKGILP